MKSSNIGGQAVIEGIMMKNGETYAVAVRKPDKEIELKTEHYEPLAARHKWMGIPFIRGVFNFIDSMTIGMGTLTYSASFYEEEEEKTSKKEGQGFIEKRLSKEALEKLVMGLTVAFSILLAVGIFMVLPVFLANIFRPFISSNTWMSLFEGVIRILIFIAYVGLISRMEDIKRVFMYHGAEHKCINCIEHGMELTVENVQKSSRLHKRCGTSFMLIIMVVSIIFTMAFPISNLWLRVLSRLLLIPIIAGVSYEFLKLAGRNESALVNALSKPGLWMQKLTTREPEDDMVEVAIQAVEAVFDWRAYLEENFDVKS